jgi:hypothetical protein
MGSTGNLLNTSKFSVKPQNCYAPSVRGLLFGLKEAEIMDRVILSYLRGPLSSFRVKLDTCISAGVRSPLTRVLDVLRRSGWAKILAPIVQRIAIYVVASFAVVANESQDDSMHSYSTLLFDSGSDIPTRVERACAFAEFSEPLPLREIFVILDRYLSKLALSEGDEAIIWKRAGFLLNQVHGMPLQRHNSLSLVYQGGAA